ncbi:hypothetical protein [Paenibacillus gansuensis]|uniref:DUF2357 domain-containing protein n=1 Tax=Paenibacillus gansuensis TaxID=306542 RepID=A0ABW5PGR6_9BACL
MATYYRDTLPFRVDLVFGSDYRDRRELRTFWDHETEVDRNALPEVREMVPIGFDYYLINEINQLEATVQIETTRFNEDGDQQPIIFLASPPGQVKVIFSRESSQTSDSTEYPWRMGYYTIKVTVDGRTYFSGIQCLPNNLTLGQVTRIHQLLENEVSGICSELVMSQRTFSEDHLDTSPSKWYHDYARWLQTNKQSIMACIEYIRKYWYKEIRTVHVVSSRLGIQDSKAERWNNATGAKLNQGTNPQLYYLNRRKQLHSDNPQNQWMKSVIQHWKNDLLVILIQIREDMESTEKEIQNHKARMNASIRKLDEIKQLRDVPEGFKKGESSLFHTSRVQIEKLQKWLGSLKKWDHEIKGIAGSFGFLLSSNSFNKVRTTENKPILKNRYYHLLDELYSIGQQIKKQEGDARQYKAIPWPTWRIYEYYSLLQVMKSLKEIGFRPRVGFPDHISSFLNQGIPEGSRFILENEVGELHVHYGKLLPYSPDDTVDSDGFYSMSEHRWPDIRIDYHHKTSDGSEYSKNSIVFDAKLSSFRYLFRPGIPIKPFTQLNSYLSIQHTSSRKTVVDRVCCLFAGFGGNETKINKHSLTYIRLCPDENEHFIGLAELQEFLLDWLTNDCELSL